LVHEEKGNITSPHNVYKYFTHFKELNKVKTIKFCKNLDKLEIIFINAWLNYNKVNKKKIDIKSKFFSYYDRLTYAQRLKNLCDKSLR
jgi:hypothetical protein